MCGIVGILGKEPVAWSIVDALKRLEYRGYDSAGIAMQEDGDIKRVRASGKLENLSSKLNGSKFSAINGIGHTRWATHGVPNETNAHPHVVGDVAIVHNGIIENFKELKETLLDKDVEFESQTDTEVVAHLIDQSLQQGLSPINAVQETLEKLEGAFAFGILFKNEDDLMIGARKGSPLAIGFGDGEMFLGSDAIALAPFTNRVCYLEDGDWAVLRRNSCEIFDVAGDPG